MTDGDINEISFSLGEIRGQLTAVMTKLEHLHDCVESLKDTRSQAKGAWKLTTVIATAAGAVAGYAMKKFGL